MTTLSAMEPWLWIAAALLAVFAIVAIVRKLIFVGILVIGLAIALGVGSFALF